MSEKPDQKEPAQWEAQSHIDHDDHPLRWWACVEVVGYVALFQGQMWDTLEAAIDDLPSLKELANSYAAMHNAEIVKWTGYWDKKEGMVTKP